MKGTGGQPECMDVRYELPKKKEALERYMKNLPGPVMVAFSGGVDSSLLLAAAWDRRLRRSGQAVKHQIVRLL